MACSTASQFAFSRTTNTSSPPNQILIGTGGSGQSSTTSQTTTAGVTGPPTGGIRTTSPHSGSRESHSQSSSAPPPIPSVIGPISGGSTTSSSTAPPPSSRQSSPGAHHQVGCCESGRPMLTDPVSGQTVCSCQYDAAQLLGYQRLAAAAAAASSTIPAGLTPSSMYTTAPYPASAAAAAAAAVAAQAAAAEQGAYIPLTADQSAFYSPNANGFDLKENLEAWRSLAAYPSAMYYPYESPLAGYPFANGYGVDLNGARRKNATRETTSTLKAWLSEHRKNPYPTKGEKIMLAIITKMTLTQVSTWFANARRRLKKENKMTWEPRNRCDEDDDMADVDGNDTGDNICNSGDEDHGKDDDLDVGDHHQSESVDGKDDVLDVDDSMVKCPTVHPLIRLRASSPESRKTSSTCSSTTSTTTTSIKPRIWSIVDTATSTSSSSTTNSRPSSALHQSNSLYTSRTSPKILPQLTRSRLDYASLPYHSAKPSWYPGTTLGAPTTSVYSNNLVQHPPELTSAILPNSRIAASFSNGLLYQQNGDRKCLSPLSLMEKHRAVISTVGLLSQPPRLSSSAASVTSSPPSSPEIKTSSQSA